VSGTGWPMADTAAEVGSAEEVTSGADARLVRDVRWRLVAWSGGSTLLVLIVLGIALYLSVASSLAASSQAVLEDRAEDLAAQMRGEPPTAGGPGFDFLFGGGTFAIAVDPSGEAYGPRQFQLPTGLPDTDAVASAKAHGSDVRTTTLTFPEVGPGQATRQVAVPVRQLTVPVDTASGRWAVQVVQDRSTEQRTLQNIVFVLVLGGIVVVLVAGGFGWVYARRALVPIRDSLAGQRVALRRQREFAADASHELRTPLTVIRASVEHLRRNATKPVGEVGDALVDIDAEVQHLTTLVDDLLLLARSDSGAITLERVPLHLDDVATDAAAALAQPAADAGVRVEVDPEPTAAVGDPARLRQLVMILVDNAIRHSPRGGAVRVVVRPGADGGSTLAVEDAGTGVAPEDRAHVFDRFWRAPGAPDGGTGLGLAIAKWIAEHHDGTIAVDQSDAGGARFEVRLPGDPASPRSEAPA
jgi:two-component system, OmpR family, sensor histidine kinase CiaH